MKPALEKILKQSQSLITLEPHTCVKMSPIALPKPEEISSLAKLQTIQFPKILIRDLDEVAKLQQACEMEGFFYLDFTDKGSSKLFNDLHKLEDLMVDWFWQPLEKKLRTENVSNAHG